MRRRGSQAALPPLLCLSNTGVDHETSENAPENAVLPLNRKSTAQPEPLVRMKNPGHHEHEGCREHDGWHGAIAKKAEDRRIVEHLHQEVSPVGVHPAPQIGKTRREKVQMARRREIEAKQMQQADDQVKLSRDAKNQAEGTDKKTNQSGNVRDIGGSNRHILRE